jgi:imidazolonepropionase-like amidohydrolase
MVIEENRYVKGANPGWIEHTQRIIEFNRKLIVAFAAAGIPIVAGTDAQVPGVVPGFSLQDELQSLAQAGLSNEQVLESATRLPAQWLGTLEDRGTVATGKRADLLLLEKNPLERIENTRAITAVIVSGKAYSRSELDRRMAELRQRNAVEH